MMISDERIAAILTDDSRFRARVRKLWTDAAQAGDEKRVRLCREALVNNDPAAQEACARVLAETESP